MLGSGAARAGAADRSPRWAWVAALMALSLLLWRRGLARVRGLRRLSGVRYARLLRAFSCARRCSSRCSTASTSRSTRSHVALLDPATAANAAALLCSIDARRSPGGPGPRRAVVVAWFTCLKGILDAARSAPRSATTSSSRSARARSTSCSSLADAQVPRLDRAVRSVPLRQRGWRSRDPRHRAASHRSRAVAGRDRVDGGAALRKGVVHPVRDVDLLVVCLAFVVVKVDNLYLFASVYDAARWPSSVFPARSRSRSRS